LDNIQQLANEVKSALNDENDEYEQV